MAYAENSDGLLLDKNYISYVPTAKVPAESRACRRFEECIARGEPARISGGEMHKRNVESYVFISCKYQFAICDSYQIYKFSDMGEYAFVPTISLNPIDDEMFIRF